MGASTDGNCEPQGDLTIVTQLKMRDVHWATLLSLLNNKLAMGIIVAVTLGTVYTAISEITVQTWIMGFVLFIVFGVSPWLQAIVSKRNPVMKSPFHHTFSASGISSKFQGGNVGLEWPVVRKARETQRYITIWGKHGGPMLIPKMQLRETELTSLRTLLNGQLQAKAQLFVSN